ncbi:hypothetical protein DL98DRAFT_598452 [Cadophora sp. DSE1049]|nr:hypothetical protein DL98DRAFT_598452 [Cadophora sp. DSE1049]
MQPFEHLQTFHLTFYTTTTPRKVFWMCLGKALCTLKLIQDLRFGFTPLNSGYLNRGTLQDNDNTSLKDWYVPIRHLLAEHTWRDLKSLRLDGLKLCGNDLRAFLLRHSSTVKELQFCDLGLWQGSIKGLLHTIRESFNLDMFYGWGLLMGIHSDGEAWRVLPLKSPWESQTWSDEFTEFAIKNLVEFPPSNYYGLSETLKMFVRGKIPWLITSKDTDLYQVRRLLDHSSACAACVLDPKDVRQSLDWRLERRWSLGARSGFRSRPAHRKREKK